MSNVVKSEASPSKKKVKIKDVFLVVSDQFVEKYSKCKATSCVTREHFGLLNFYKDNKCLIGTIEDDKKNVYGRVILWGKYYDTLYYDYQYQSVFKKLLKRAGFMYASERLVYPLVKMEAFPYLDGFDRFNTSLTSMSNYRSEDFCLAQGGGVPNKRDGLRASLMYVCPDCGEYHNLCRAIKYNNEFSCPDCDQDKVAAAKEFIRKITPITAADGIKVEPLTMVNAKGKKHFVFKLGDEKLITK
jgi:hypothetical protein